MTFTLVGNDNFPSAAYASLDTKIGAGDVLVAAAGVGPDDGFSGYRPLTVPPRPRWGEYGAAVTDGSTIAGFLFSVSGVLPLASDAC